MSNPASHANTPRAEFQKRFPELYRELEAAIQDLPKGITVELQDKNISSTWKRSFGTHYHSTAYTDNDVHYLIRRLVDDRAHYEFLDLLETARGMHFRVRNFRAVEGALITIPKAHHIPPEFTDEIHNNDPIIFSDTPEDVAILRKILGVEAQPSGRQQ